MASYGTKKALARAIESGDKPPMKRYLRELVIEDGPIKTGSLLQKMSLSNPALPNAGLEMARDVLAMETKANLGILKRRFPETWHSR